MSAQFATGLPAASTRAATSTSAATRAPAVPHTPAATRSPAGFSVYDFDGFEAAVSSSFVPLRVTAERRSGFRGGLRTTEVEHLAFSEVVADAHRVDRSAELISRGGGGFFKLSFMLSGSGLLVQDGREARLSAGDAAIYDTARPYTLEFDDEFRNLVVMLPKQLLDVPPELVAEITATRLPRDTPMGTIVSQTIPHVPGAILGSPSLMRHRLARTTLELLSAHVAATLGEERIEKDPRRVMVRRIREYIEDHLQDPDLSPASIAAAHFLSTRRMHGLFQEEDTTIAAHIRELRLEHCRVDLMNPAFADLPVSAISARWGFTDAAHFSRSFRAQFGCSPRELRGSR